MRLKLVLRYFYLDLYSCSIYHLLTKLSGTQRHWSLFSTYWRYTNKIIIIIIIINNNMIKMVPMGFKCMYLYVAEWLVTWCWLACKWDATSRVTWSSYSAAITKHCYTPWHFDTFLVDSVNMTRLWSSCTTSTVFSVLHDQLASL